MNRQDMLAGLMGQATLQGGDLVTLRAIVEEASEIGADRAMTRLGLSDAKAQDDIDELRELLGAWRDAKSGALKSAVAWLMRGILALLLIGIAVRIGVPELLR
ncbi:MAG: DUF6127 family protein [Pontixanthobacter sp.]